MGCGLRDQRGKFLDVGDADGSGGDAVIAVPVGEHDQLTRCMPRDAEELVGPECLGHQDSASLVVPLDPHATTFVAGEPLVNLADDVFVIRSEVDAEFRAGRACRDVASVRSGLEATFGEPGGERHGEGSELWSVTGGEGVGSGGESVGCDGVSVGPVLPGDEGVVSGFSEFGGWVVVVDLSPPGPEVSDVADEIAAFTSELGALLEDGAGLLGDIVKVMFGGGDVAFSGGQFASGVASFTPAAVVDGSLQLTAMLLRVVECASGGVDGVIVGLAGGFEFVEQYAELVDALIDAFLLGAFGTEPPERVEELGMYDLVGLVVPGRDLTARPDDRRRRGGCGGGEVAANTGCRSVGAVAGQDLLEDVDGVGDVVAVGDHQHEVLDLPTSDRHIQPATRGGRRRQSRGTGSGVGLVARLGGGVAELHMFGDVGGGQRDGAVAVDAGHRQGPVGTDGVNGPVVAVADALPCRRSQESFVAACRDHVPDRDLEAVAEFEAGVAELAKLAAVVVDGGVDGVDVVIGGGRDRHVLATVAGAGPVVGEVVDVLVERCREDAVMIQVGVEPSWVAVSQLRVTRPLPTSYGTGGSCRARSSGRSRQSSPNMPPRPTACNW